MLTSVLNLRLQQLEENILRILKLLSEYETELLDEDDPGKISKYHRRIKNLNQQKTDNEKEFEELQAQLMDENPQQAQSISIQLKEIDTKIEFLLSNQIAIEQGLKLYFNHEEQKLIASVTQQLNKNDLVEIQSFLEAINSGKISEEEIQEMLNNIQSYVKELKNHSRSLPEAKETIIEMMIDPKIDAKSALKISIPIIPFILSYEGEIGLGAGINLKKTWQHWRTKFYKK